MYVRIILYLCTRYHAVLALRAVKVWAQYLLVQRLTTRVFGLLKLRISTILSKTLQSGCLGRGYITPRQCVVRLIRASAHLTGVSIYNPTA